MLEFADNFSGTHSSDLIIVGGDLNSSPGTPVYNKFSQMVDCLVDKLGSASSSVAAPAAAAAPGRPAFTGHPVQSRYTSVEARAL